MADINADAGTYARATRSLAEIAQPFAALYRAFWTLESLPAETLELCRLRQAQLLGSDLAWRHEQFGLSAQQREDLKHWPSSPVYSDAEKACLEFTEIHAMDARAITDAQADAVKQHYGDVGLVALVQALGVFDAVTRLGLIWDLETLELNAS
ncbi:hypothetical protein E2F43_07515 [Seongchinamella unica]|uniref:Carboxymuconolactone decarboxylase-like domain-containing protein n=1 Tax=Seongchinamella unica TaxID=2547392 RepID=A0A4R5LRB1_9GAMM|nr:hypothetical protein [Seongchinamella unica]TDG13381.1 hypothetical protein E2F43_07515 [Seongchinamella unica]